MNIGPVPPLNATKIEETIILSLTGLKKIPAFNAAGMAFSPDRVERRTPSQANREGRQAGSSAESMSNHVRCLAWSFDGIPG